MTERAGVDCERECHLVQAVYREMPGLCLTAAQMRRLWRFDPVICEAVLFVLVSSGFLRRSRNGVYVHGAAVRDAGRAVVVEPERRLDGS